jgi:hypothetical protein
MILPHYRKDRHAGVRYHFLSKSGASHEILTANWHSPFSYRILSDKLGKPSAGEDSHFLRDRVDPMKAAREKPMVSPRKRSAAAVPTDSSQSESGSAVTRPALNALGSAGPQWTFLTNHAHVLVLLARTPSLVLREVALQVGITERAVQRIIADLEAGGIIEREKIGRRNRYQIRDVQPLRHPIESHRTVRELLALINGAVR